MMTISRLSAGDGYSYYTSVTARGDQGKSSELGDYYLATGTPRGQWVGRGAQVLGMEGDVTESHMRALFGEGLHPNADILIAEKTQQGLTPDQAINEVRLGRKFARFETPDNELRTAIDTATSAHEQRVRRPATPDERTTIRMRQAGIMFRERNGRSGSPQEVAKLLATELGKGQNAVAGFDLTFSAPKSVSIAWAVADQPHAQALEAAHTRAIETTIAWMENEVIRTRTGAGGIALHATSGLVGTRFRHWESREGDPQLHDHVVVANRVQITDAQGQERWLTIDSRGLYHATMNASSVYNRVLADELKQLGFQLRQRDTGSHTGMELACVSDREIARFSSRSAAIKARTDELVHAYIAQHGRRPATKELLQLKQQATLETRIPKSQAVTRPQLRTRWRTQLGTDSDRIRHTVAATLGSATSPQASPAIVNADEIAANIIDELSTRQSTWNRNHVETRINMWAAQQPYIVSPETRTCITHAALNQASIRISATPTVPFHPELVDSDGRSIYTSRAAELFTSHQVLAAEDRLVDAAHRIALPTITPAHFQTALNHATGPIDTGQIALARDAACSEQLLSVGIGPAGTGKTTALKLAVAAAREAGVETHGVTVSAAAADQLQRATGMESTTIAKWLLDVDHGAVGLNAGDIIIVDEAGMASARDLAAITERAYKAGAFVRLIGDDRQLQAIGAGGSLKMLTAEVGAVHLDQLHRFDNQSEAAASLRLREHGDVAWYLEQERVHGGTTAHVFTRIVDAWARDQQEGRTSLMMAGTNQDVATLNHMAQDVRLTNGEITLANAVDLADGNRAGLGDRIVTRRNNRRLTTTNGHGFVKNGDLWTITAIHTNGSISVQDSYKRSILLPADYVREATGLGYATTVHRAQGQSVDVARLLLDDNTSREALYVGLTRGRQTNEVYAITDGRSAPDMLRRAAARVTQATSARELIQQAQDHANHPATLVRILHDMQTRADQHRYSAAVRAVLPTQAAQILISDRQQRLFTALTRAENAGFAPQRVLRLAANQLPEDIGDPTGLLAWRIDQHTQRAHELAQQSRNRPLHALPQHRLDQLLTLAGRQRQQARAQVRNAAQPARLHGGDDVPAWTQRVFGTLTDAQLGTQLQHCRAQARLLDQAIKETQTHRQALTGQIRKTPDDSPLHTTLLARQTRLDQRITRLQTERRNLLVTQANLKDETSIRAQQLPNDWAREQRQRVATSLPITTDQAAQHAEHAHIVRRELWIEQRLRDFDPDPRINHRPPGSPSWAIPGRGHHDPNMPQSWRQPLAQMGRNVDNAIRHHGATLAMQPPQWATNYLGPVPTIGTPQRQRWEYIAGQIDTIRDLTDHTDPLKALPTPRQAQALGPQAAGHLHTLHAAASDLRLNRLQPRRVTPSIAYPKQPDLAPHRSSRYAQAITPPERDNLTRATQHAKPARAITATIQRLRNHIEDAKQLRSLTGTLRDELHQPLNPNRPADTTRAATIRTLTSQIHQHSRSTSNLVRLAETELRIARLVDAPIRGDETFQTRTDEIREQRATAARLRNELGLPVDDTQRLAHIDQRIQQAVNQPLHEGETITQRLQTLDQARDERAAIQQTHTPQPTISQPTQRPLIDLLRERAATRQAQQPQRDTPTRTISYERER